MHSPPFSVLHSQGRCQHPGWSGHRVWARVKTRSLQSRQTPYHVEWQAVLKVCSPNQHRQQHLEHLEMQILMDESETLGMNSAIYVLTSPQRTPVHTQV